MKKIQASLLSLILLLATPLVLAQDKPPQFLNLFEIKVKLSMMPQWEAYVHKVIEVAEETGSPFDWMMLQVTQGGEAGTFFAAIPFDEMSELDNFKTAPEMLVEALGGEEAGKILGPGLGATESVNLETYALLEDFSTHFDSARYAPNFYYVIRTQMKPHMNTTYRSLLARGAAAAKAREDGPMTIRRTNIMGKSFRYMASSPFNSWGEEQGPDLGEIMNEDWGEEAAREFFASLNRCIEERETMVIKLRRDLSRMPD